MFVMIVLDCFIDFDFFIKVIEEFNYCIGGGIGGIDWIVLFVDYVLLINFKWFEYIIIECGRDWVILMC